MISTRELKNYYTPRRRAGNSTRLADFAIQKLFDGEEVLVEDHYEHKNANRHLLNMILKRLELQFHIVEKNVKISFMNDQITIQLVANYKEYS